MIAHILNLFSSDLPAFMIRNRAIFLATSKWRNK